MRTNEKREETIMRFEDYVYQHNGGWWFRTSPSTSSGPFPNESILIDQFVLWMAARDPLTLVRLSLQGREVMEENIHKHPDDQFYYHDFEDDKCIGPYFTQKEAIAAMMLRAEQIHKRDTVPRRAA